MNKIIRGFTLIELMIVVAIVGIFASIVVGIVVDGSEAPQSEPLHPVGYTQ